MKINKRTLLNSFKADLKAAEPYMNEITSLMQGWKDAYDGKPYGNEQKGKSTIVSRDIKRQSEWQHASLVDPFVSNNDIVKCNPVTFEDTAAARQSELILNTQFCRKFPRFNFISNSIKILDREGTLIVQTGWEYEGEEVEKEVLVVAVDENGVEFLEKQVVTEIVTKKNQPTAIPCRMEDIFIDPTCMGNLDNAQFIIHRYETDLSTLRKDGRYSNLDKINVETGGYDGDYTPEDTTNFTFQDKPRKKLVVYEYWGNYDLDNDGIAEPIVGAWVGDIIIRLEDNPYPDGKPPFLLVPFNPLPFKLFGEANASLVGESQQIKTAVLRGILDNMTQSNNGQIGIKKGTLDPINRQKFKKGQHFEYNTSMHDFWQGSYNSIPNSVFDLIAITNNEIESLYGVKGFSSGISGTSLGQSATAARGALDASAVRRLHIVRNISENLIKPLMRKWNAYNAVFLDEEEVIRITNEDFVTVRRDDLLGNIDIDITVSTAEDNAARAQELTFILQTLGPSESAQVRRKLLADILDLIRLPEEAKELRELQEEPDPFQEELKQLELERAKKELALLDAQIEATRNNTYAATELTRKKAGTEESKARKLDSEADKLDLEFLMRDEGIDSQHKAQELENKRLHELDILAFQAMRGDTNLGVRR